MPGTVASYQARVSKPGREISAGLASTVAASASSQPRSRNNCPSGASAGAGRGESFGVRVVVTAGTGFGKVSGFCGPKLRGPRNSVQRLFGVGPSGVRWKDKASRAAGAVCIDEAISPAESAWS